jgi:hypothetical protein
MRCFSLVHILSLKKSLALTLAVVMTFELCGVPFTQASQTGLIWHSRQSALPQPQDQIKSLLKNNFIPVEFDTGHRLSIPSKYGQIVESWSPETPSQYAPVIHIQDLHSHEPTQWNIAQILRTLKEQASSSPFIVGIEGAWGALDFSSYDEIPFNDMREMTTRAFLERDFISGPHYFGLQHPSTDVRLMGLESKPAYLTNLKLRDRKAHYRKEVVARLRFIQTRIHRIGRNIYPRGLQELEAAKSQYEEDRIQLSQYLPFLTQYHTDLTSFPQIQTYGELMDMESRLSHKQIKGDRQKLLTQIISLGDHQLIESLMGRSVAFKEGRLNPLSSLKHLTETAERMGLPIPISLHEYMKVLQKRSLIKEELLVEEIERLTTLLTNKWAEQTQQVQEIHQLITLSGQLRDQIKLWELQLTSKRVEDVIRMGSRMDLKEQESFLQSLEIQLGLKPVPSVLPASVRTEVKQLAHFYDLALQRDQILTTRLVQMMKKGLDAGHQKSHVIVAGGFHTEGITQRLETMGIPYYVIQPQYEAQSRKPNKVSVQGPLPSAWDYFREQGNAVVPLYPPSVTGGNVPQIRDALVTAPSGDKVKKSKVDDDRWDWVHDKDGKWICSTNPSKMKKAQEKVDDTAHNQWSVGMWAILGGGGTLVLFGAFVLVQDFLPIEIALFLRNNIYRSGFSAVVGFGILKIARSFKKDALPNNDIPDLFTMFGTYRDGIYIPHSAIKTTEPIEVGEPPELAPYEPEPQPVIDVPLVLGAPREPGPIWTPEDGIPTLDQIRQMSEERGFYLPESFFKQEKPSMKARTLGLRMALLYMMGIKGTGIKGQTLKVVDENGKRIKGYPVNYHPLVQLIRDGLNGPDKEKVAQALLQLRYLEGDLPHEYTEHWVLTEEISRMASPAEEEKEEENGENIDPEPIINMPVSVSVPIDVKDEAFDQVDDWISESAPRAPPTEVEEMIPVQKKSLVRRLLPLSAVLVLVSFFTSLLIQYQPQPPNPMAPAAVQEETQEPPREADGKAFYLMMDMAKNVGWGHLQDRLEFTRQVIDAGKNMMAELYIETMKPEPPQPAKRQVTKRGRSLPDDALENSPVLNKKIHKMHQTEDNAISAVLLIDDRYSPYALPHQSLIDFLGEEALKRIFPDKNLRARFLQGHFNVVMVTLNPQTGLIHRIYANQRIKPDRMNPVDAVTNIHTGETYQANVVEINPATGEIKRDPVSQSGFPSLLPIVVSKIPVDMSRPHHPSEYLKWIPGTLSYEEDQWYVWVNQAHVGVAPVIETRVWTTGDLSNSPVVVQRDSALVGRIAGMVSETFYSDHTVVNRISLRSKTMDDPRYIRIAERVIREIWPTNPMDLEAAYQVIKTVDTTTPRGRDGVARLRNAWRLNDAVLVKRYGVNHPRVKLHRFYMGELSRLHSDPDLVDVLRRSPPVPDLGSIDRDFVTYQFEPLYPDARALLGQVVDALAPTDDLNVPEFLLRKATARAVNKRGKRPDQLTRFYLEYLRERAKEHPNVERLRTELLEASYKGRELDKALERELNPLAQQSPRSAYRSIDLKVRSLLQNSRQVDVEDIYRIVFEEMKMGHKSLLMGAHKLFMREYKKERPNLRRLTAMMLRDYFYDQTLAESQGVSYRGRLGVVPVSSQVFQLSNIKNPIRLSLLNLDIISLYRGYGGSTEYGSIVIPRMYETGDNVRILSKFPRLRLSDILQSSRSASERELRWYVQRHLRRKNAKQEYRSFEDDYTKGVEKYERQMNKLREELKLAREKFNQNKIKELVEKINKYQDEFRFYDGKKFHIGLRSGLRESRDDVKNQREAERRAQSIQRAQKVEPDWDRAQSIWVPSRQLDQIDPRVSAMQPVTFESYAFFPMWLLGMIGFVRNDDEEDDTSEFPPMPEAIGEPNEARHLGVLNGTDESPPEVTPEAKAFYQAWREAKTSKDPITHVVYVDSVDEAEDVTETISILNELKGEELGVYDVVFMVPEKMRAEIKGVVPHFRVVPIGEFDKGFEGLVKAMVDKAGVALGLSQENRLGRRYHVVVPEQFGLKDFDRWAKASLQKLIPRLQKRVVISGVNPPYRGDREWARVLIGYYLGDGAKDQLLDFLKQSKSLLELKRVIHQTILRNA